MEVCFLLCFMPFPFWIAFCIVFASIMAQICLIFQWKKSMLYSKLRGVCPTWRTFKTIVFTRWNDVFQEIRAFVLPAFSSKKRPKSVETLRLQNTSFKRLKITQNQYKIDLKSLEISLKLLNFCKNAFKQYAFPGLDFWMKKRLKKPDLAGERKAHLESDTTMLLAAISCYLLLCIAMCC